MKKKVIISILVLAIVGAAGFGMAGSKVKKTMASSMNEITIAKDDIVSTVSATGSIHAEDKEKVISKENGSISEVKVKQYDNVEEGDVLMVTSSGKEIESPIHGEVSNIYVNEGDMTNIGGQLMDVTDYDSLELVAAVDELDIAKVKVGQSVKVSVNSIEDKEYTGKIKSIAKEGIFQNGISTFEIKISLDDIEGLLVGMSADIKVQLDKAENVILIPIEAVQYEDDDTPYVFVKSEEDVEQKVEVELGLQDGVNVEVTSGLNENDVVLYPNEATSSTNSGLRFMPPMRFGGK